MVQSVIPETSSVDQIKSWITEYFGMIPNKSLKRQTFEVKDESGQIISP